MDERSLPPSAPVAVTPVARLHRDLASVRDLWLACEAQGVCNAHQRYGWMALVVEHLLALDKSEPLIVELRDAASGAPILLLPLAIRRKAGLTEIVPLSAGVCDYTAPVLAQPAAYTAEEARRFWLAVRAALPKADRLRLDSIPHEIVPGIPNPLALVDGIQDSALSVSGMATPGPADTLAARVFRPSFVKQVGKTRRRLEALGTLSFEVARTPAEVDAMIDQLLHLRLARFRKLGRFDILSSPAYGQFYRQAAHEGLSGGSAQVIGLKLDGDCLALMLNLVHRDVAHGILIAMDDERARNTAPGLFMISLAIEQACREGVTYFDFSVGGQSYKQSVGALSRPFFRLEEVYSLRGHAMALADKGAEELRARLKSNEALYGRLRSWRGKLRCLSHRPAANTAPDKPRAPDSD
ncbi:hypothetical protein NS226_08445 [Aureimonas ureilytica]|uniref:BioF2-like acetyltransferase domain-containing protein n=1 Tax=Aureimonas ureilytica TaxID=401562 RepID=A0A175R9I4_9HYPH|nr:GNAT family N-acetyltransferase [Aureimonas ureilytica]KTQ96076.1 hypothetical protein NS226_08445 [Aureimonas ureilytica]